jgi:putative transcriptional regulator
MKRPVVLLALAAAVTAWGQQYGRTRDLAPGKFLVASKDLADPNFAESVVLLIQYGEDGAMGLVINRRSRIPLSKLFSESKQAKGRSDTAYLGGPVERAAAFALLRSKTKVEDAQKVLADVYLISTKDQLDKALSADANALHVYLGYSGWGPGQLDRETELGGWHVLRADSGSVFDPDPDAVWPRLIRTTEIQVAGNQLPSTSEFAKGRKRPSKLMNSALSPATAP